MIKTTTTIIALSEERLKRVSRVHHMSQDHLITHKFTHHIGVPFNNAATVLLLQQMLWNA